MPDTKPVKIEGKDRFLELDALRGFAALFVLAFHSSLHIKWAYPVLRFGISGVDLFFMISGFVIMLSLSKVKHGYQFVINRFSRLFPTYWTAATLTFAAIFLTNSYLYGFPADIYWKQYFANLTMLQFYLGFEHLDGPYWTLTVELLFYAYMLALFLFKGLRSVVLITFAIILFGLLITLAYWGDRFSIDYIIQFPLSQFFPLFLAGILFLKLYYDKKKSRIYTILIVACYAASVLMVEFGGRVPTHVSVAEYAITAGFYFVLFFLFVYGKLKLIVNKVTVFLGRISYALYLIHQFLLLGILIPGLMGLGVNYYVAAFVIGMPVCILIATLITYKVEKPAGKWMKNKLTALFENRIMPLYRRFHKKLKLLLPS